ncbi:GNAT family N-acetyltransferase [Phaeobacter sp. QD34_3]|uniref:GNAT family N-acetyltransferase n=1 Tax=unclassified Phaeobacter TaxID=2621772 RepID=UPI00237F3196|nr:MULTISPECIES: GNAT family N-acetyltransferase [unclassified Phaeobacter]MDE4132606.1 GNAT family N-acetyltransferase [Phaeobacter sp. QD34_3]MDE4136242.1 GNAT family N-acetyltransferase [Phaeobacter sp. QD34_24]
MSDVILETERLILRPHRVEDFPDVAALWADPVVVRHISGVPSTPEASWSRLLRNMGHWQAMGYGYWAVTERSTGDFLGEVGFSDFKREIDPPLAVIPEAGWVLATHAHGRGIAGEAVTAMHDWADAAKDWAETVCLFDPAHAVSQKVALKLGYRVREQAAIYQGKQTLVMSRVTECSRP